MLMGSCSRSKLVSLLLTPGERQAEDTMTPKRSSHGVTVAMSLDVAAFESSIFGAWVANAVTAPYENVPLISGTAPLSVSRTASKDTLVMPKDVAESYTLCHGLYSDHAGPPYCATD